MAFGKAPAASPAADGGALAATELNDFGFDLLRRLDPSGNLVASPASIALALGMVRPGAKGQTAAEMDKVLHSFGTDGQAAEVAALLAALASQTVYVDSDGTPIASPGPSAKDPAVELDISDQAFIQRDLTVEAAYLDALSSSFGAGIGLLDYKANPEAARLLINKWASDRTKGRIPNILEKGDIDTLTRLVLVNAIYLKAAWNHEFDPKDTANRSFTTAAGSAIQVPTMAIDAHYHYAAGTGYKAIDLPYVLEGMAMTIVVPDDMAGFVRALSSAKLAEIVGAENERDVDFQMPKFSIESRVQLADVLSAMGMKLAFDPNSADFAGITTEEPLYISKVIHQANIDVVEQGTTAAAVTAVAMTAGAAPVQPQHVQFHVDKPFLYFIRDTRSGAVLFMGRVDDPSAK
jgi:serpin B